MNSTACRTSQRRDRRRNMRRPIGERRVHGGHGIQCIEHIQRTAFGCNGQLRQSACDRDACRNNKWNDRGNDPVIHTARSGLPHKSGRLGCAVHRHEQRFEHQHREFAISDAHTIGNADGVQSGDGDDEREHGPGTHTNAEEQQLHRAEQPFVIRTRLRKRGLYQVEITERQFARLFHSGHHRRQRCTNLTGNPSDAFVVPVIRHVWRLQPRAHRRRQLSGS